MMWHSAASVAFIGVGLLGGEGGGGGCSDLMILAAAERVGLRLFTHLTGD